MKTWWRSRKRYQRNLIRLAVVYVILWSIAALLAPTLERKTAEMRARNPQPSVQASEGTPKPVKSTPRSTQVGDRVGLQPLGDAGNSVVVWKSYDAQERGSNLARANASILLILPHVACMVDPGTDALITDRSIWRGGVTVTVLTGPKMGCEGVIHFANVAS